MTPGGRPSEALPSTPGGCPCGALAWVPGGCPSEALAWVPGGPRKDAGKPKAAFGRNRTRRAGSRHAERSEASSFSAPLSQILRRCAPQNDGWRYRRSAIHARKARRALVPFSVGQFRMRRAAPRRFSRPYRALRLLTPGTRGLRPGLLSVAPNGAGNERNSRTESGTRPAARQARHSLGPPCARRAKAATQDSTPSSDRTGRSSRSCLGDLTGRLPPGLPRLRHTRTASTVMHPLPPA